MNSSVRRYFVNRQLEYSGGLINVLSDYYRVNQGWDGVETLLAGADAAVSLSPQAEDIVFALTDNGGNIIYPTQGWDENQFSLDEQQALPILVDGQTVGRVHAVPIKLRRSGHGTGEGFKTVSRFLFAVAIFGGALGIAFGVVASRSLTAPLSRLAEAARRIGRRDFSRQVEVAGSDEVQEVARAFNEMVSALEEAETLRRNLVADVAHELRTPLSVLQGNLRAILDGVYPLEQAEIARLYDQTRLLNRLVNDLRELAQAEAGQLALNLQAVDLANLLEETAATFSPVAEAENVTLETKIPADLPPLRADAARLAQVLHNLLSNALRHTPPNGVITLSAGRGDDQLWVSVSDTGEGISPEDLPHIFERLYRADRTRVRATGGAGLGLAIAKAIVEEHSGVIAADSSLGRGSTFTIRFPL